MNVGPRGAYAVVGAVAAGALVWAVDLVLSLVFMRAAQFQEIANSRSANFAALRLALVVVLGLPIIVWRANLARWALVVFFCFWSAERLYWASRGNLTAAFVAPVFAACAIALGSRLSSRFIKSAV